LITISLFIATGYTLLNLPQFTIIKNTTTSFAIKTKEIDHSIIKDQGHIDQALDNHLYKVTPITNHTQILRLENGYYLQFTKWVLYILKDKKNIKGESIPFIQPQQALTKTGIKNALQTPALWPSGYSLTAALKTNTLPVITTSIIH
jgi:hypothetical protein